MQSKKKTLITTVTYLFLLSSFGAKAQMENQYSIDGYIEGFEEGEKGDYDGFK